MTGLIGIFSKERPEVCQAKLNSMLSSIMDEQFYKSGVYKNEDQGVYLGWTCIENSFDDGMPVLNETRDMALVLSGDIYLDPCEIHGLKKREHAISGANSSVLVHLYEERGISFINELNGWFSGVLIDRKAGCTYIFNDRYGMRRIFIYESPGEFCIASQARAILAAYPKTRGFDLSGLAEYLTCGCTLGKRSLFKDIQIMPAASLWQIKNGAIENKVTYFDRASWEGQDRLDSIAFMSGLEAQLKPVIREYGNAPSPVGISLTGGLDTRMVVACLDMEPGKYPCYTFGSMYRDTFDVKVARRVADSCGQIHSTLILGRDFLADFPRYLERGVILADGNLSLAGAAALYVNSVAREISPVRLTGNYGSELFRGVRAFKSVMPKTRFYVSDLDPFMLEAMASFNELERSDPISFSLFHQAPCLGYGLLSVEGSQVIIRTPFMDNRLAKLAYQGPRSYTAGSSIFISILKKCSSNLANISSDFGYLGQGGRFIEKLRHEYRRALFKAEYWSSHGMPHWVANCTELFPWLSPEKVFLGRHKYQHFRKWIREDLSAFYKEIFLTEEPMPDIIDKRRVAGILNSHIKGQKNYLDELEKILTIVMTRKLFFQPK